MNSKKTSSEKLTLAAIMLRHSKSSKDGKSLAGSVLTQQQDGRVTSDRIETLAQKVLLSSKYSYLTKSLAGSAFSQSD